MPRIEVLCATMHQADFSKIEDMHIRSDVVFANQSDDFGYAQKEFEGFCARMLTTPYRGVGKNRNEALLAARGDICVIADDDAVYSDGYERFVAEAYERHPDADMILFAIDGNDPTAKRKPPKIKAEKRLRKWDRCPYGGPSITFRRDSVLRANVWFSLLFGGGCPYSSGEDSKFIQDCRNAGLRIYLVPEIIATVDYGDSSWFSDYNEKFFFDKGAFFKATYGNATIIRIVYYGFRMAKKTKLSVPQSMSCMRRGASGYKKGLYFSAKENAQ